MNKLKKVNIFDAENSSHAIKFEDFFGTSFELFKFVRYDLRTVGSAADHNIKMQIKRNNFIFWLGYWNIFVFTALTEMSLLGDINDTQMFLFGISLLLTYVANQLKVLVMAYNKNSINQLLENLKHSYPKSSPSVRNVCRGFKVFQSLFCGMNLTLCGVTLVPLARYFIYGDRTFIVPFPQFLTNEFVYPVALIWSNVLGILGIVVIGSFTLFNSVIIIAVSVEFYTLADRINSMQHLTELKITEEIPKIVKSHTEAFKLVSGLEKVFSVLFFTRFIVSASIIGINLFQLRTTVDIFDNSIFLIYTCFELSQVFLQCYFGQFLIDASSKVVDEICSCGWENWKSVQLKKQLLIVIQRAQKPAYLTIFNFGVISIEQFSRVRISISF